MTQKWYVVRHDMYLDQEHFETNQKSLRPSVQKLWLKQWSSCFW